MEFEDDDERGFDSDDYGSAYVGSSSVRRRKAKRVRKSVKVRRKSRSRKVTSHTSKRGRIKYTKRGQPYIILKSGKARFLKKNKRR
jgi:hypothetical protein